MHLGSYSLLSQAQHVPYALWPDSAFVHGCHGLFDCKVSPIPDVVNFSPTWLLSLISAAYFSKDRKVCIGHTERTHTQSLGSVSTHTVCVHHVLSVRLALNAHLY